MKHPVTLLNDPIHEGLIASYAHPGGNVTGIDAHRVWARASSDQLHRLKTELARKSP
jgi:hypothetical protein